MYQFLNKVWKSGTPVTQCRCRDVSCWLVSVNCERKLAHISVTHLVKAVTHAESWHTWRWLALEKEQDVSEQPKSGHWRDSTEDEPRISAPMWVSNAASVLIRAENALVKTLFDLLAVVHERLTVGTCEYISMNCQLTSDNERPANDVEAKYGI